MADKEENVSKLKAEPTPAESFLFICILKHMKSKPDVDWNAVALEAHYANALTAKTRFRQIKKRLGIEDIDAAMTPGAAASPAAGADNPEGIAPTPKKRGRPDASVADETPVKTRKTQGVRVKAEDAVLVADPDAEYVPQTGRKKRAPRPRAANAAPRTSGGGPRANRGVIAAAFGAAGDEDAPEETPSTPVKANPIAPATTPTSIAPAPAATPVPARNYSDFVGYTGGSFANVPGGAPAQPKQASPVTPRTVDPGSASRLVGHGQAHGINYGAAQSPTYVQSPHGTPISARPVTNMSTVFEFIDYHNPADQQAYFRLQEQENYLAMAAAPPSAPAPALPPAPAPAPAPAPTLQTPVQTPIKGISMNPTNEEVAKQHAPYDQFKQDMEEIMSYMPPSHFEEALSHIQ